jgi:uridine kinase
MGETPFVTTAISVERRRLIASVADIVLARVEPIVRVAVDGISGAGKSTFAHELAVQLQSGGRATVRASVDDFHRPKAQRYRLGRDSPDGHYVESYDYEGLRRELLDPLQPGGSRLYRTAIFDCVFDSPIESERVRAYDGTILIVDGLFLNRDELRQYWDVSIFLAVSFDIAIERCARRDGSARGAADPSNRRYVVGETRYLNECRPQERASIVIDNSELSRPVRLR